MCRALGVKPHQLPRLERRARSDRALSDAWLTEKIKQIHAASGGTYGARRVHAELRLKYQIGVGRKRVERLMRTAGISGVLPRERRRTTVRLPGLRVPPDLVERDFRPDGPNLTWSAHITYISTWKRRHSFTGKGMVFGWASGGVRSLFARCDRRWRRRRVGL